jgi:phage shock protein A
LRPFALDRTLDEFANEAAEIDADELPARLKALEGAYHDLDQHRQQISTSIGQEQEKLQSLETSARLARAEGAAADCEQCVVSRDHAIDRSESAKR